MAKPVLIKKIDLLVHPFFYRRDHYSKEEAGMLLKTWKRHIDEVAKDPNRLLFACPSGVQSDPQKKRSRELFKYAKETLGKRFGLFAKPKSKNPFYDNTGKPFTNFESLMLNKGFVVKPSQVKTRAFGEYTHVCVTDYLTKFNIHVGLQNIIPYRNKQSTIMPRKSVGSYDDLLKVKDVLRSKELAKTPEGKKLLKELSQKFSERRIKKANMIAMERWGGKKEHFKTRIKRRK